MKWPPCHVKLLLFICAILLNRWVILIYYFFYGYVKLWRFYRFWLYGGHCVGWSLYLATSPNNWLSIFFVNSEAILSDTSLWSLDISMSISKLVKYTREIFFVSHLSVALIQYYWISAKIQISVRNKCDSRFFTLAHL